MYLESGCMGRHYKKKASERELTGFHLQLYGAPGEIRTPDRLVRSQVLYPTELRAHKKRNFA